MAKKKKTVEEPKVEEPKVEETVEEPKAQVEKPVCYIVKKGCSIVCRRGILGAGKAVRIKDFPNGIRDIEFHCQPGQALEKVVG